MQTKSGSIAADVWLLQPTLWVALETVLCLSAHMFLMMAQGLGLRDEALYLLEADAPQPAAKYAFSPGWYTGSFLILVGGDLCPLGTARVVRAGLE